MMYDVELIDDPDRGSPIRRFVFADVRTPSGNTLCVRWPAYGNTHYPAVLELHPSGKIINYKETTKIASIIRGLVCQEY
jgi:hypothetical protein